MKKQLPLHVILLVILLTACVPSQSASSQVPEPDYWPTARWESSSPEAQGMDSGLLAKMLEEISNRGTHIHSVTVIRNGYVVAAAYFHPYTPDTKIHIQSVTKSVIGMLIGKAIADGTLKSEEERLVDFYQNRVFQNPGGAKNSIRLKHLLSMSSGLECQEFSGTGPSMEQTSGWVQFMLDRPMKNSPGKVFGYCNGNAHLLSAILEEASGKSAREYANQELFQPLGIAPVSEADWGNDPQKITLAGYGLHLRPLDLAKLALLYLNNGKWDGKSIIPAQWVADSTRQHVRKEDGSGYGYLWTVYPKSGHYAALGMGGQQIHVYPAKNLIVVVSASLESYAEAPEIEQMLNEYILPAIQSDSPLAKNPEAHGRLVAAMETAAHPVQSVPSLPAAALENSHHVYTFEENPFGWNSVEFAFEPGRDSAQVILNEIPLEVGLDHIYRSSEISPGSEILLRGRWEGKDVFVLDYPYPLNGPTVLGELGESQLRFRFSGNGMEVTAQQVVFGGEPLILKASHE